METKTAYKTIKLDGDKIKPVIKAALYDDHLVLSAEESEGIGLLLDRCSWLFPGKGDSESYSTSQQDGVIMRESHSRSFGINESNTFTVGSDVPVFSGASFSKTFGVEFGNSHATDITNYQDFINTQESFSTDAVD